MDAQTIFTGKWTYHAETPKEHVRRLTMEVLNCPWYQPLLFRSRQRSLKKVMRVYKEAGKL